MGEFKDGQLSMILYALSSLWHEIKDSEETNPDDDICTIYSKEEVEKCYFDIHAIIENKLDKQ